MMNCGDKRLRTLFGSLSVATILVVFAVAGPARAYELTLQEYSANSHMWNDPPVQAQVHVYVTDPLGGQDPTATQALFRFSNDEAPSNTVHFSITDLYWDDGTLLDISQIFNDGNMGAGDVSFHAGASPSDLPQGDHGAAWDADPNNGYNNIADPFNPSSPYTYYTADSDGSTYDQILANGVNVGDSVAILFDLQNDGTFANVLEELADKRLRVGVKIKGLPDGWETYVNNPLSYTPPPPPGDGGTPGDGGDSGDSGTPPSGGAGVPEPATAVMGLLGLACMLTSAGRRRR